MTDLYYSTIHSPIGNLYLVATADHLIHLFWSKTDFLSYKKHQNLTEKENKILRLAKKELNAYFSGNLKSFTTPTLMEGTPFQEQVWKQLKKIPYSKTISYKDLANRIKNKNASRAVGSANAKNPLGIFIPCHRVITSDGKLGGFAGGMKAKQFLIDLEAK